MGQKMKTRIQKWGNSFALRIPKSLVMEAGLDLDTEVDISFVEGKIVVLPTIKPKYNLDDLLAQVTDDNQHGEIDLGKFVGKEVW